MATSRAYLKIQDGCSGKCAFCIVPQFRGPPVSVPFGDVLARARAFLDAGFRELVVTGCNLALYRSEGQGLADLLSALAEMGTVPAGSRGTVPAGPGTGPAGMGTGPRHRVRLGSLEPGICDDAVLDAFAAHPNICRFIHLSLQSGSDAVLRRMNRPYTAAKVARFCDAARRRLGPDLMLGADVIAGFPGETEADHAATKAFLSAHGFANQHVFPYSERPGTPAATMDGALPVDVRRARAKDLERDGHARRNAFAATFLGRTVVVCVERGGRHGWTAEYLPCELKGPAKRRSLVQVDIGRVEDGTLFARD